MSTRTDNGNYFQPMCFDMICEVKGIEHRLIKHSHPLTNGQVEQMLISVCKKMLIRQRNRTVKESTVKQYH